MTVNDQVEPFLKIDNWIYLDRETAEHHTLYGVSGWLGLLQIYLIVVPFFWVLSSVLLASPFVVTFSFIADRFGDNFNGAGGASSLIGILIITQIVFMLWAWVLAYNLSELHKRFQYRVFIYLVSFIVLSLLSTGRTLPFDLIWLGYVLLSKQLNVTCLNRVRVDDEFLDELDWPIEQGLKQDVEPAFDAFDFVGGFKNNQNSTNYADVMNNHRGPATSMATLTSADQFTKRIEAIDKALQQGLITQAEYDAKKQQILEEL